MIYVIDGIFNTKILTVSIFDLESERRSELGRTVQLHPELKKPS